MFGENWSRGTPDRRRPRARGPRRTMTRAGGGAGGMYHRGYRRPENAPRGRMSAYAFFIQTCREEHKQRFPEDTIVFREFSRQCADRWKELTVAQKQHFSDMATQDRARYAKELQSYRGPRIRNRRRKTRKDPRAPKRALSAFFWFCSDERPKVRAVQPSASVGKVAKELGSLWSSSEENVREKYEKLALEDKHRYDQQMIDYKAGNFSRHVEGMEHLPPPDPNNLGKLPNVKLYTYHKPSYIGHVVGTGQGSDSRAGGSQVVVEEEEEEIDEMDEEEDEEVGQQSEGGADGCEGGGVRTEVGEGRRVDDDEEEEEEEDDEDEMVSDEEMVDEGSVIEDNMPNRGLPPPEEE